MFHWWGRCLGALKIFSRQCSPERAVAILAKLLAVLLDVDFQLLNSIVEALLAILDVRRGLLREQKALGHGDPRPACSEVSSVTSAQVEASTVSTSTGFAVTCKIDLVESLQWLADKGEESNILCPLS